MSARAPYHHGNLGEALLSAAEAELTERGVEAFSLRGVARRAGVSHAAPAHHFGDTGGLLTALAARGFARLLEIQRARKADADADPFAQLTASGLGYVEFALVHPALFRLMFTSRRPDHGAAALKDKGGAAYAELVADVAAARGLSAGAEPSVVEVVAAWSAAHGLAELLVGGRAWALQALPEPERKAAVRAILERLLAAPDPREAAGQSPSA